MTMIRKGLSIVQEIKNVEKDREYLKRHDDNSILKKNQKAHQEAQAAKRRDFAQFNEAQKVKKIRSSKGLLQIINFNPTL